MSTQYTLTLSCRRCGHEVMPVAQGKPQDGGDQIRATCECEECGARWLLAVVMAPTYLPSQSPAQHRAQLAEARSRKEGVRLVAECGTPSGAVAHGRRGEEVCAACRESRTAAQRLTREKAHAS